QGEVCANGVCGPPDNPCAGVTCHARPPRCDGNVLVTSTTAPFCDPNTGTCAGETFEQTDCTSQNQVCVSGACVVPRKRVFATVGRYTGDLATAGGSDYGDWGADALCQLEADASGLGGVWKAWVSTAHADAIDRFEDVGPWYLLDNTTLIANNLAQLVTQGPRVSIRLLADGTLDTGLGFHRYAWTGTRANGRLAPQHCNGFTTESDSVWGWNGDNSSSPATDWTYAINNNCSIPMRLYCFEQ